MVHGHLGQLAPVYLDDSVYCASDNEVELDSHIIFKYRELNLAPRSKGRYERSTESY